MLPRRGRRRRRGRRSINVDPPPKGGRIRAASSPDPPVLGRWREISRLSGYRGRRPRKLKLCADNDVPQELIEAFGEIGIPVETATDAGLEQADDHAVKAWAKRMRRVLLTFNHRDFWNDQKHPLQQSPGIIAVAIPNNNAAEAAPGLGILLDSFASYFTLDWWTEMKVRVTATGYRIKRRQEGRNAQYEVKYHNGRFYFRKI